MIELPDKTGPSILKLVVRSSLPLCKIPKGVHSSMYRWYIMLCCSERGQSLLIYYHIQWHLGTSFLSYLHMTTILIKIVLRLVMACPRHGPILTMPNTDGEHSSELHHEQGLYVKVVRGWRRCVVAIHRLAYDTYSTPVRCVSVLWFMSTFILLAWPDLLLFHWPQMHLSHMTTWCVSK